MKAGLPLQLKYENSVVVADKGIHRNKPRIANDNRNQCKRNGFKKNKTQIKANGYDIGGKLHVFLTMHAKINY